MKRPPTQFLESLLVFLVPSLVLFSLRNLVFRRLIIDTNEHRGGTGSQRPLDIVGGSNADALTEGILIDLPPSQGKHLAGRGPTDDVVSQNSIFQGRVEESAGLGIVEVRAAQFLYVIPLFPFCIRTLSQSNTY